MAISTNGITLMKGTVSGETTTYLKLVDIKDFTDMGAAPTAIETTTLSDSSQTFIEGIKAAPIMTFTANYTVADYALLDALTDNEKYAIYFGLDGVNGKFALEGKLSVWIVGGAVNGVVNMKISITPTKAIEKITA